mgnify:CR=1 FL=1
MRGGTSRDGGPDQFERQHRNADGLGMCHGQGNRRLLADLQVGDYL